MSEELQTIFGRVKEAARTLNALTDKQKNDILNAVADGIIRRADYILEENAKDLSRMDAANPKYDRLRLTVERLHGMASDTRNVASLPSPLGRVLRHEVRPNGMELSRVSVPFGVIGVVYEARPNVSVDVFSLCFKSGNACMLKGGSDAVYSNRAIVKVIHDVLRAFGVDSHALALLPPGHDSTAALLNAGRYVEVVYQPFNPEEQKRISFEYAFTLIPLNEEQFEAYCETIKNFLEVEIRRRNRFKEEKPEVYEKLWKTRHLEPYSPAVRRNLADVVLEFHGIARNNPEIADFLADQYWYPVREKRELTESYRQLLMSASSGEIASSGERSESD